MIWVIVFLVSLCLGSFANNLTSYYTEKSKFDLSRSTCLCGERSLKFYELLPIISFMMQRGRCVQCKRKIPYRYPVVELAAGVVGIVCLAIYDLTIMGLFYFLVLYILLIIAFVDLSSYRIPNQLIIGLLLLAVVKLLVFCPIYWISIGIACFVAAIFVAINQYYMRVKKKLAIGYGDVKLIFVLMLLFNLPASVLGLWLSSLLALIGAIILRGFPQLGLKPGKLPFGFFLWLGYSLVTFLF